MARREQQTQNDSIEFEPDEVDEAPAAPAQNVTKFVQFMGGASVREITRQQWANAGVQNQQDAHWTISNRHLLPLEHFSDAALDVLMMDGKFRVVTADEVS